jgi:hypothetical protein
MSELAGTIRADKSLAHRVNLQQPRRQPIKPKAPVLFRFGPAMPLGRVILQLRVGRCDMGDHRPRLTGRGIESSSFPETVTPRLSSSCNSVGPFVVALIDTTSLNHWQTLLIKLHQSDQVRPSSDLARQNDIRRRVCPEARRRKSQTRELSVKFVRSCSGPGMAQFHH